MEKLVKYAFMILIAVFFTALLFYAAHVIFTTHQNDCWDRIVEPKIIDGNEPDFNNSELLACSTVNETNNKSLETKKVILIGIINILVLIGVLILGFSTIGLGLFFGIILSSIIATLTYFRSVTVIGLILLIIAFIGILAVIYRSKI